MSNCICEPVSSLQWPPAFWESKDKNTLTKVCPASPDFIFSWNSTSWTAQSLCRDIHFLCSWCSQIAFPSFHCALLQNYELLHQQIREHNRPFGITLYSVYLVNWLNIIDNIILLTGRAASQKHKRQTPWQQEPRCTSHTKMAKSKPLVGCINVLQLWHCDVIWYMSVYTNRAFRGNQSSEY